MPITMKIAKHNNMETTLEPVVEGSTGFTWYMITVRDYSKKPNDLTYKCRFDSYKEAQREFNMLNKQMREEKSK